MVASASLMEPSKGVGKGVSPLHPEETQKYFGMHFRVVQSGSSYERR